MFGSHGAVDDSERVGRGEQRVGRRTADRLDEHGATDPSGALGGEGEVLGAQLVLLLRRGVIDTITV